VVTTVVPPNLRPAAGEQPSIVIAMDLDQPDAKAPPSEPAPQTRPFGEGSGHDSLIIDFDMLGDPPDDVLQDKIRPAAKPVGRGVATAKREPGVGAPPGVPPRRR
jgi:hypothetical protein